MKLCTPRSADNTKVGWKFSKENTFLFCCQQQKFTFYSTNLGYKADESRNKPFVRRFSLSQILWHHFCLLEEMMPCFRGFKKNILSNSDRKVWTFTSSNSHGDVMSGLLFFERVCFSSEQNDLMAVLWGMKIIAGCVSQPSIQGCVFVCLHYSY